MKKMNMVKKLGSKFLAITLSLLVMCSLVQIPVLADETPVVELSGFETPSAGDAIITPTIIFDAEKIKNDFGLTDFRLQAIIIRKNGTVVSSGTYEAGEKYWMQIAFITSYPNDSINNAKVKLGDLDLIVEKSGNMGVNVNYIFTIPKPISKTDKEKVEEAKPLAQTALNNITATNDTTGTNILDAVNSGISSVDGVTASWKTGSPTITSATSSKTGSITGTIILTSGSETVEVTVNKTINKLPKTDKEKVEEAKPLAQTALNNITATNDTTGTNILDAVNSGIASVSGVTATWKGTPTINKATNDKDGSITGTIILTCGSETAEITVNKTINKLPKTDKEKVEEAKPLAQTALNNIKATNDTTSANILDAVKSGIASVSGVTATWKGNPTISKATNEKDGSITGIIVLTCGSETLEVTVNKAIAKLPAPTPEKPTVTVGSTGSKHEVSSGKDMTFTCSGKLEDLTGIYVDGKLVDPSNYTLKSGSTILTLKASYLDTLSVGTHTLKFQYKDNISVETEFTIAAKTSGMPEKPNSPKTGDTTATSLYIGLLALSGCAVALVFRRRKVINK